MTIPAVADAMDGRAMLRSVALALVACLAGAAVVGSVYGWDGARTTFLLLAAIAIGMLGAAHVATARRARLGSLSRQLALGAALAVGTVVAAVWVGAETMFVSHHDALVISAMATVSGVLAVRAAQLLAQGVVRDVEAMHREVDEARRRLIAAVSHDLRTPLASLRLLVDAVEDGVATGETRDRYLREMRTHVGALSVLIDDLFELSRLEAGEISWSMHQVELGELVSETVAALRAQAEERGVMVAAELPEGDGAAALSAHANAEKVQRVLFNLIVNAIRHTPADGSVVVRARPAAGGHGTVEIEVVDDGTGVAAEERERVFEPFYRGGEDGAARSSDGAGLGLAISRAIVEAHGGRIWLEPVDPRGTRVRFTLPAAA
ncbi:MAG TPA: HAMP domain-containing sensor histidine kinase [Conexibacter sp.]|nr:HAMP domain-containing sensor histidine kinase [Conexibacter sp.]